jgi:pilus assembly protein CpaE
LIDGKLSFGHLDVMLNIRSHNTIADLIPHASSMDESLIYDVVAQHVSGIHVLLGPSDLQVSQGIRADDLYSVLSNLQHHFDLIVIDGGSTVNENSVTLMDLSDRVFLVSTPDLASLYDSRRFSMLSRSLGYGADKLLIVINRSGMAGGVRTGDIESALQKQVFMQIPDDPERCNRSLNRGIPLTLRYMRSPASKGILELARMVSRLQTAEQVQRSSGEAQARPHMDALLASSRLG